MFKVGDIITHKKTGLSYQITGVDVEGYYIVWIDNKPITAVTSLMPLFINGEATPHFQLN